MFKVSFKNSEGCKAVTVQHFNNKETVVQLRGIMSLPSFWFSIPRSIQGWVFNHPSIDIYESIVKAELIIKSSGKAICTEGDTFNTKTGERIAESRAKIKLYKFMHTLCKKLIYCYYGYIYGVPEGKGTCKTTTLSDYRGGLHDACRKYAELWVKESRHLGTLLNE